MLTDTTPALSSQQDALLRWTEAARRRGIGRRPFNAPAAYRIEGPLDVEALRRALLQTVWHQPTLRTSYHPDGDGWRVRVAAHPPLGLRVVDLRGARDLDRRLHEALVADTETVFPLDAPARLRAVLYRVDDEAHVLSLAMDHLVADMDSLTVLVTEIGRRYGRAAEMAPPDDDPSADFFTFARRESAGLRGAALEAELGFWRSALGPAGPLVDVPLPFGNDRPAGPPRAAVCGGVLPADLLERLDRACRQTRGTRFRLVLAAIAVVLHQLGAGEAIAVRSPDGNRDEFGTDAVIGWFSNLVVYRTDLSGDPTLDELLDRIRETAAGVQAHKRLTHYDLMRELRPGEYGKPRTGTWVVLNHIRRAELDLPGLSCRHCGVRPASVPPLMVEVELEDHRDGSELSVLYDANRYPAAAVEDLSNRIRRMLGQFAGDRGRRLSELPA
ncbi:condensation domain-containing protein [Paractinoplanes atraurantiacus]|uniref:Condensation domain-containing protein n=1 Tax=Paractinoplanes atraurantiacus TaxID=1036182 RepID=A0A285GLR1_9ACTN|nr:condensation domain-containing protein [Actinoplanes atraurantiacus]SNY24507.1 Condensation domain-containing protein [Actinoplanes atraurantiacus]